jgi:hypothetical protein
MAFAWAAAPSGEGEMPVINLVSETDLFVPIQDMESVIEYLFARGSSDMLVLRLPETQSFESSGEPAVVRAADYSRQLASWNAQAAQGGEPRGAAGQDAAQGRRRPGP